MGFTIKGKLFMYMEASTSLTRYSQIFVKTVCALLILVSFITLLYWTYNSVVLAKIISSGIPIKASVAICFGLSGFSLWFLREELVSQSFRWLGLGCAAVLLCLAIFTLLGYICHALFEIRICHVISNVTSFYSGNMSWVTAFNFALTAISLLFFDTRLFRNGSLQVLVCTVLFLSLLTLLDYLYDTEFFGASAHMALLTAVLMFLLSTALLLARPTRGIIPILFRQSVGGHLLRRTLPFIFLSPIVLSFFQYFAYHSGLFSPSFNVAVMMSGFILILIVVLWANAITLDNVAEKRAESDARLNLALQSAGAGSWSWDIVNDVISWDENIHRVYGCDADDLPINYRGAIQLVHPEDQERFAKEIQQCLEKNIDLNTQRRVIHPDGTIHYIETHARINHDEMGRPIRLSGVCLDITHIKQTEENLRHAKEIAENWAVKAEETNRLKSEFLANMSHELRTPLNAIIGFAELMFDEKTIMKASERREYLDDILTSARHLLHLINDILDLTKVEAGRIEFQPELVQLKTLLTEVHDTVRTLVAKKQITFSVTIDPLLTQVIIDPAKLRQILYNYLSNAIKFTPVGGTVSVHAFCENEGYFRIDVKDNGIGISPEDIDKLFVEFQQLDESIAKKYSGTGLGLALTRRIATALGGRVGVESMLGKGSIFYVVLPITTTLFDI